MKQSICLTREGNALVPADRVSEQKMKKLKPGKDILCWTHSARNPKQLRLVWAIAELVAENSEEWPTKDEAMDQIKFSTGHTEERRYRLPGGVWMRQVRTASIAYESMKQEDFVEWLERAIEYITSEMVPGMNRADLEREVNEYLGVDDWPARTQQTEGVKA